MNGPNSRLRLANSNPNRPAIRAVLVVQLEVDEHAVARLPRRWRGDKLPRQTQVRIDVGGGRHFLDYWGEIGHLVQDCATVEVVGVELEGIAGVRAALLHALSTGVPSAC